MAVRRLAEKCHINGIPAVLWGKHSDGVFVAIHGLMSNKEDENIAVFAEEAMKKGYQVLSFDLPKHGERVSQERCCNTKNGIEDLKTIMEFARNRYKRVCLFACSMGAYFSLLAYADQTLEQCLFLSPVVDMEQIVHNMMFWNGIDPELLEKEKRIAIPDGPALDWEDYCYIKQHPVKKWKCKTAILYGENDNLCRYEVILEFARKFGCGLKIMPNGEHYFHTLEQLDYFKMWLKKQLTA